MLTQKEALPLKELPIFRGLESPAITELIQGGIAATTKHRGILYRAGEPAESFALVLLGAYKLFRHDLSGNESIMHFASPGDTIGGLVMLNPNPIYPVTCASIGTSMVLKIPRDTWVRSWATNVVLQQRVNRMLYQRMTQIQDEKALGRLPLSVRVATLLVTLLERYSSGSERILPIPVTRQEIADSVASTVESVIRLLSEWNQEGIIRTESRQLEIVRLDRLIEIGRGMDEEAKG
jgi:CRP/FNR family transcriptional regulator